MFCSNCGKELKTDGKFCPNCGKCIVDDYISENPDDILDEKENADKSIKEWFYIVENERIGPLRETEVKELIERGYINRETSVWNYKMDEWKEAGKTELVKYFGNIAPAIPLNQISSAYAWALATIPMIASIMLYWFTTNEMIITGIVIALNIIFLSLDYKVIKKSGHDIGNWIWMGIVLIPIYLLVRAIKIDRQYGYVIIWALLFLLTL